jgi:GTP:adenosylcobinamide-phosphate guanylyltransferase
MDARAGAVWMTEAEAAVDVDKVADWRLVEKILAARQRSTSSP